MNPTAIHEAGHACIAADTPGVTVRRVSIVGTAAGAGHCEWEGAPAPIRQACIALAGPIAESKYLHGRATYDSGATDRQRGLDVLGRAMDLPGSDWRVAEKLKFVGSMTRALVVVHWRWIEVVAMALSRYEILTGEDVVRLRS